MAEILRVKTRWSGFNGAPGYTVMHFRDFGTGGDSGAAATTEQAQAAATKVQQFFNAIRGWVPAAVRFDVEPDVDVLESTTGELINSYGITAPAQVSGTGTGTYSAATGAVVNWKTGGIRNGRKIRGRTFLVPVSNASMTSTGTLDTTARGVIVTAAAALADSSGSPDLGVYARPSGPGATDGQWSVVTASSVPTLLAVLRSRRD